MLIQIWNETRYWNGLHICVNTYQSPLLINPFLPLQEPPVSLKDVETFLMVALSFIVVPISFFNDEWSKFFFTNWMNLFISAFVNVLTKSLSSVNRTLKLKINSFKYISDTFRILKKLIKYIFEIVGKLNYGMPFVP